LEGAVVRARLRDRHGEWIEAGGKRRARVALVLARHAVVRVDRQRRDKDVMLRVPLHVLRDIPHPGRQGGRIVDHDVELSALEGAHVAVQVADQLLDTSLEEVRSRLIPVDERDSVAAGNCIFDLLGTGEAGAAEDQNVERRAGAFDRCPTLIVRDNAAERELWRGAKSGRAKGTRPGHGGGNLEECPAVSRHERSPRWGRTGWQPVGLFASGGQATVATASAEGPTPSPTTSV